ncbi:MAG: PD-(D/E)XK nuclease-like domain-containing protein [Emticicia sp.]|uniref:PD-(D/E)XK nuclease-like domain-containing protein n=1 Tax=Emticicia sp. TaxID=1930953 RepID=UPI003BA6F736
MQNNVFINNYRAYPSISNSDLTEFKNYLFGLNPFKPYKAFAFGSVLHSKLLEPHSPIIIPQDVDIDLIENLISRIKQNRFCSWVLNGSHNEMGILFNDKNTKLPCKAKLDLVCRKNIIVDIKTTSQRSYNAFVKSCYQYEYDRQAAFYLDAHNRQTPSKSCFFFVGVQKKEPYDIFVFDALAHPNFIKDGRNKYQMLLQKWQEVGGIPNGFIAPSWNMNLLKNVA